MITNEQKKEHLQSLMEAYPDAVDFLFEKSLKFKPPAAVRKPGPDKMDPILECAIWYSAGRLENAKRMVAGFYGVSESTVYKLKASEEPGQAIALYAKETGGKPTFLDPGFLDWFKAKLQASGYTVLNHPAFEEG